MKRKIAIIDCGIGNLCNVKKAFDRIGVESEVTRDSKEVDRASGIVLPGVGAFGDCMDNLERFGLLESVFRSIEKGKPYLGICLGMQILFTQSEEFGLHKGLDLIPGRVIRFASDPEYKVPHMGWNTVVKVKDSPILQDVENGDFFYFVHSYYAVPDDNVSVSTFTSYGVTFASSVWKENIFATQFHPEKSQKKGLRILELFSRLT